MKHETGRPLDVGLRGAQPNLRMLRNGAPIRQLQEMLGHASLETTQLYTRVTINDLRDMHARYHPRETSGDDKP